MASGSIVSGNGGDEDSREKQKWTESKVYTRKSFKVLKNNSSVAQLEADTVASEKTNSSQQRIPSRFEAASNDSATLNRQQVSSGAVKLGFSRQENRVTISLLSKSKQEMRELRRKLKNELDRVRSLVVQIEAKDEPMKIGGVDKGGGGSWVHSEVVSTRPPRESRPLHQLSISVLENSQGLNDNAEKEKRTPKANQFYRNSEFLLAKDKIPPPESNKKSKSNGKKGGGSELGGFGLGKFSNQVFKSCSNLLERLMKHKHAWVFNTPVDTVGLGLQDYFDIIKHPMDLGTVKSRLSKNWYKSPREFAEDVRLTFHNAMTYNPKGQDVYLMAEQLLKLFEAKWAVIETDYMRELRLAVDYEVNLPTPTSRKAPPTWIPAMEMKGSLDRAESTTHSVYPSSKPVNLGRTPAPKKPKAKDPNKREMTSDEKHKLSTNLQNLPSEKLENIIVIIKKRNSSLCQRDDEIEVDIDNVDTETLWELDRFVTNYKKSLSKNKRKAELTSKARSEAEKTVLEKNPSPFVVEVSKHTTTEGKNVLSSSPVQFQKAGDNASKSSSSSSSGSESGSSSSDSDSESSTECGSDAAQSPRT